MTGVAYMNSCMPNCMRNFKSLYFVVHEENRRPHDMECKPIMTIRTGKQTRETEREGVNCPETAY